MLFPAVIHSDDGIHYGIFLPDIPGVFSGGHSPEECLANVQEAVEMVCTARGLTAPAHAQPSDRCHGPGSGGGRLGHARCH